MDIRLPDGTLFKNVPAGTTQAELEALVRSSNLKRTPPPEPNGLFKHLKDGVSAVADRASAVASGFNRGALNLAGMPVDAVANVRDLGKAAIGSAWQATTGKPAPDALLLTPRENDVGSSAWLTKQARKTQVGRNVLDPSNPEYEGGYLQAIGSALPGIVNPRTRVELTSHVINNATSAGLGKAVGDATDSPELGMAAGMAPTGTLLAMAGKGMVRGGPQGRQEMVDNIDSLNRAGVTQPTLALASGNRLLGAVESLVHSTPGGAHVMEEARRRALNGMQRTVEDAVASTGGGGARGPLNAGTALQSGLDEFVGYRKARQELFDQAARDKGTERAADWARTVKTATENRERKLQPTIDAKLPEKAVQDLDASLTFTHTPAQTVMKSLPEEARSVVAGTLTDRLGRIAPGAQYEGSPPWSHEAYLSNWNRIGPDGRDVLFNGYPAADRLRADSEAVAQAATRMRDNSRMWAHQPTPAWADTLVKGSLGRTAAAGGLLANEAAQWLTSPQVVRAVASPTTIDPRLLDDQLRGLVSGGLFFTDLQQPQAQQPEPFSVLFAQPQD